MSRYIYDLASLVLALASTASADGPAPAAETKPQWQRLLQGDDAKKAVELQKQIAAAEQGDQYAEAIRPHEELLALRKRLQGGDHWQTVNETWDLDIVRKVAALPAAEQRSVRRKGAQCVAQAQQLEANGRYAESEPLWREFRRLCERIFGENHPATARSYNNLAVNLNAQGKCAEAQPLYQKALDLRLQLLGEKHPDTAESYNNLAVNLKAQGQYATAQPLYQKALELRRELLGEKHRDTAQAYANLAGNLDAQGNHVDAFPLCQKALHLRLELLGEKHRDTAHSYGTLATNIVLQGRYAEAQPLFEKAARLSRDLLGEKHPDTISSCIVLGVNLHTQGKYAEAQPIFQSALHLNRELLGEDHPQTQQSYTAVGMNLSAQGKYAEAQPLFQNALDQSRKSRGEKDPYTAACYNALAANLNAQGKYAEAQPLYQKALDLLREQLGGRDRFTAAGYGHLAVNLNSQGKFLEAQPLFQKARDLRRELLGEKHPETAQSYNDLAVNLNAQGRYAEAQPLYQKALDLYRELLGEKHPETAQSYNNVAYNLNVQGKYAEAAPLLIKAGESYEAARLTVAARGLERAVFGAERSPYRLLAATQAHLSDPSAAWTAAETDLARGLTDESASRRGVALTAEEQKRQANVNAGLGQIGPRVLQLASKQSPTETEKDELVKLLNERRTLENQLAELAVALSQRELATLVQVRAAIPADAALVMWVDVADRSGTLQDHWGCLLRPSGGPHWERLPGTGPESRWTDDDSTLPRKFSTASAVRDAAPEKIADLARKLYAQRMAPLEKHLEGVTRLFVVPAGAMAGVPLDALTDKYLVSYVPAGTLLARLQERAAPIGRSLLALGDPVFPRVEPVKEPPLPPGGLLIAQVLPRSNAAQASLRRGDVLLSYAGAELSSVEQLGKLVQEHAQDKTIAITAWRDGETAERELAPGKLGVQLEPRPAPEVVAERGKTDQMLRALARGGEWPELPGTTVEVARLKTLAGDENATVLIRSAASEQQLEQLRASGKLAEFRYLHFATHGEPNNARSFESALILSQDQISEDVPVGGGKYYDGRLTANEVLESWQLNADLVTLSACESALGRPGGGDGLLGFAQAFLLAGARSVCLTLWKVEDTATALLMDRFYQNLLGKRDGLSQPLPKAEALAEAKRWLRNLTTDEATKLTADLTAGAARGKGVPALALAVPVTNSPVTQHDDHPFAHPRYWAAFILIGDPN